MRCTSSGVLPGHQTTDMLGFPQSEENRDEEGQLGQGNVPALDRHGPFLAGILNPRIRQFQQTILVREAALGLGQLAVHSFDGVRCVNYPATIWRVLEVRCHRGPPMADGMPQHWPRRARQSYGATGTASS